MLRSTRRGIAIALIAVILAPWTFARDAQAVEANGVQQAPETAARPRIGLVLAGGGAKGGAHVGVLKVLEEMRVPIDCIAGTSMGALVGAGYASGQPAAQLEQFMTGIDWPAVVGGVGRRDLQPIEQKRAGVTYTNDIEFGLKQKSVVAPSGFVNTNRIDDLLRSYVASARMQPNFDRLPIPFRAVATDMIAGEMVVLDHGDLATAMRASMAIPGVFAPVKLDGRVLADGGMMRNIPVDVARNLCADVVIVVNLVETAVDPEKLNSAVQLMSRGMDVMIVGNESLQLASLQPGDVRIDVQVGDIGSSDFEQIPVTIPLGETAARAASGRLREYSVSPTEYAAWRERVTAGQEVRVKIADVRFAELSDVNEEFLRRRLTIKPGDTVDTSTIGRETQRLWALGDFETVGYRLTGDPDQPTLEFIPEEKNWRPDYLRFDVGLYASEGGDFDGVLFARHNRRWINSRGGQWNNEVQIGGQTRIETSFNQPLDMDQRFFVEPRAFFERSNEDIYLSNERLAVYRFRDTGLGIDSGLNFGSRAQARIGYVYSDRMLERDTGTPIFKEYTQRDAGIRASAIYDSRDTAFSPTRGIAAALEYFHSDRSLGAERDWKRAEMGIGVAMPLRGDVLWMSAAGGASFESDLPFDRHFALGGPGSFPGYEIGELRGTDYWTVQASYLWKIKEIIALRGDALYAGFKLQGGQMNDILPAGTDEDLYGASGYLTGRTPFGPLTFGLGVASNDSWTIWMALGRPTSTSSILERGIFR